MNNIKKSELYTVGLCLIASLAIVAYQAFGPHTSSSTDSLSAAAAAEDQGRPATQAVIAPSSVETVTLNNPPRTNTQPRSGLILWGSGHPADTAIVKLAYDHPELELRDEEIIQLQLLFTEHYASLIKFENSLAHVSVSPVGTVVVDIPAYPSSAGELLKELLWDAKVLLPAKDPNKLDAALTKTYAGFSSNLGNLHQRLVIKKTSDPKNPFVVSRQVTKTDSTTGLVMSKAETTSPIGPNIAQGVFAGREQFFEMLK